MAFQMWFQLLVRSGKRRSCPPHSSTNSRCILIVWVVAWSSLACWKWHWWSLRATQSRELDDSALENAKLDHHWMSREFSSRYHPCILSFDQYHWKWTLRHSSRCRCCSRHQQMSSCDACSCLCSFLACTNLNYSNYCPNCEMKLMAAGHFRLNSLRGADFRSRVSHVAENRSSSW